MDETTLLPCPFCGLPPEEVTCELNKEWIVTVACNSGCGASGPFLNPPFNVTEASAYAIDGWNRRAQNV